MITTMTKKMKEEIKKAELARNAYKESKMDWVVTIVLIAMAAYGAYDLYCRVWG